MLGKNGALCFSIRTWAPPGQKKPYFSHSVIPALGRLLGM